MKKVYFTALGTLLLITVAPLHMDTWPLWAVIPIMVVFGISGLIVGSLTLAVIMSIVDRDY